MVNENVKKASLNTHPLPPIDRWIKYSFNYCLMTHTQLHNFIIHNEMMPPSANSNHSIKLNKVAVENNWNTDEIKWKGTSTTKVK